MWAPVLPAPSTDAWHWQLRAECRGADCALFFAAEYEPRDLRFRRERMAKQICRCCPVLAECRTHALSVGEPYGVWGGLSENERQTSSATGRR
jgi:WhiB family redox-sensing transcriptional regulator